MLYILPFCLFSFCGDLFRIYNLPCCLFSYYGDLLSVEYFALFLYSFCKDLFRIVYFAMLFVSFALVFFFVCSISVGISSRLCIVPSCLFSFCRYFFLAVYFVLLFVQLLWGSIQDCIFCPVLCSASVGISSLLYILHCCLFSFCRNLYRSVHFALLLVYGL